MSMGFPPFGGNHIILNGVVLGDLLDRAETAVFGKCGAAAQDSGENQCNENDDHSDVLPAAPSFPAAILCNISIPLGRSGFPISSTGCAAGRIGWDDHFNIGQLRNQRRMVSEFEYPFPKNILHLEQNILRSMVFQVCCRGQNATGNASPGMRAV
jgi:hypothetical protein